MSNYFIIIELFISILICWIYICIIVPKVKTYKSKNLKNYMITGFHDIKILYDYYKICSQKQEPLFWFYSIIALSLFFILVGIVMPL